MLNKLSKIIKAGVWKRGTGLGFLMGYAYLIFLYMFQPGVWDKPLALSMGLIFTSFIILLTFLQIVVKILMQAGDKTENGEIK
jgi:hypothetical protein